MSDIKFHCPECGGRLVVDEKGVGLTVQCPHCSQSIIIPNPNAQEKEAKRSRREQ